MFGNNMGAPLYEGFDNHPGCDNGERFNVITGESCCPDSPTYDEKTGNLLPCPDVEDETDEDSPTISVADPSSPTTSADDPSSPTTSADDPSIGDPFVGDGERDEDDEDDENDEDNEEDEEEDFVGNNVIEGFEGNNVVDKVNVNFVLKCVLFACLFYILAHDDSRNYIVKMLKTKKDNYIYLSSILFLVIYFILNLIL